MIGAGPSLERNGFNLHAVSRENPSILLIATDAAVPFLWRESIYPDIVVTAEEQCRAAIIFKDVKEWPAGVNLVVSTTANPFTIATLVRGAGIREWFFYNSAHKALRDRYRCGIIKYDIPQLCPQAGSITFHCVALAQWLGIKDIALCGCDMHVDPNPDNNNPTHAGGYSVTGIPRTVINDSFAWHMRELTDNHMANCGIANCSEGGALDIFPKDKLRDWIVRHQRTVENRDKPHLEPIKT